MDKNDIKVAVDQLRQLVDELNLEIVKLEAELYEQAESQNPCFLSSKRQK